MPIFAPDGHASLATQFLKEVLPDSELLSMVQRHDELYSQWRAFNERGGVMSSQNEARLSRMIESIHDWPLFMTFVMIDSMTPGKDRTPLRWSLERVHMKKELPEIVWQRFQTLENFLDRLESHN